MPRFNFRRFHPTLTATALIVAVLLGAAQPAAAVTVARSPRAVTAGDRAATWWSWIALLWGGGGGGTLTRGLPAVRVAVGRDRLPLTRTDLGGFIDPNGVFAATNGGTSDRNPLP